MSENKWIWSLPIVVLLGVCAMAIGIVPGVRDWFDSTFPQLGIGQSQIAFTSKPDSASRDLNPASNMGAAEQNLSATPGLTSAQNALEHSLPPSLPPTSGTNNDAGDVQLNDLFSPPTVQFAQANVPVSQTPAPSVPVARLSQGTLPVPLPNAGINVPSVSSSGSIYIPDGKVMFPEDIFVAAQADGNITVLNVDEGTMVKAEDIMLEIDSRLSRAEQEVAKQELEAAQVKANDDSSILYAKAAADVAAKEVEISDDLMNKGVVGLLENQSKRLELTKAKLSVTNSQNQKLQEKASVKVQEAKLGASGVQLELRQIRAPWSGVVSEVSKRQYSFVRAGDPIFRLTSMEKIRVTGLAKLGDAPHTLHNCLAKVTIQYAAGRSETMEGRVLAVAPRSTADSSTYKVWIEVNNKQTPDGQYLFREGMTAAVEIVPRR